MGKGELGGGIGVAEEGYGGLVTAVVSGVVVELGAGELVVERRWKVVGFGFGFGGWRRFR